eukprot:2332923-Rhodomonas_salina.1
MGVDYIAGKVTRVLPQCAYMESLPGVADVFIPLAVVAYSNRLEEGDRLVTEAEQRVQGRFRWHVVKIVANLDSSRTGNSSQVKMGATPNRDDHGTPLKDPHPKGRTTAKPRNRDKSHDQTVPVSSIMQCANDVSGLMLATLRTQPQSTEQIKARLAKVFAASANQVEWVGTRKSRAKRDKLQSQSREEPALRQRPAQNEQGSEAQQHRSRAVESPPEEVRSSAASVLDTVEMLLEEGGGAMAPGPLTKKLYMRMPEAKKSVNAAGGLKGFCRQHKEALEFLHDGSSKGGQGE